jgi:hypothetical protein
MKEIVLPILSEERRYFATKALIETDVGLRWAEARKTGGQ